MNGGDSLYSLNKIGQNPVNSKRTKELKSIITKKLVAVHITLLNV